MHPVLRWTLAATLLTMVASPASGAQEAPAGARAEFSTDFSQHSVPYHEIQSGGPPRDGIPPIDHPHFVTTAEASDWLDDREPVIAVAVGEDVRAYPIQILMWHEIVNDTVGGVPLAVTFCPLCNTAIAFDRRVDGRTLDFGTTGRLRYSNLIMYDRQTESWWQQGNGEAIVGELLGRRLAYHPAAIVSWLDFRSAYPAAPVLSRNTGHSRRYGRNPYVGYDDVSRPPFLYQGPATPDNIAPMARVLTLELDDEAVAYPYAMLQELGVVNDRIGTTDVVVIWVPGTASALDRGVLAQGRDVGTAMAYSRRVDGAVLTFARSMEHVVDEETGSRWSVLGEATAGPLAGRRLQALPAINHFWFSWAAFRPDTRIHQAPKGAGFNPP